MHNLKGQNKFPLQTFLLFGCVLFLAYLPVSSFLFYIKNDAFANYFPPKFFMSESIHAGYLPLWNPYINFGIPQYGDMNAGYWSPVTWLIASTVGYNAYTFTLEVLLYILLGGLGMYKLSGIWVQQKNVRIISGLAFMCCGYHVAHLQHFNWISGSAFLPWCFYSYIIFLNNSTTRNTLIAVLFFYLFISSAHPGLMIGSFYFFIAVLIFSFLNNDKQLSFKTRIKKYGISHLLFILAYLPLAIGIIAGYTDIIPQFARGEKTNLEDSLTHSSNLQTWISLLLPFSTVKNGSFFNTELTLRNSYFSLTLLLLFLVAIFGKKTRWQIFLLLTGISFALLSAGGWAKMFAHHYLPYMGYVRLNGEFRIFALMAFIIVAAIELEKFINNPGPARLQKLKWIAASIMLILIFSVSWAIQGLMSSRESILFSHTENYSAFNFSDNAKNIIDALSFYDTILIQGLVQIILLLVIYKSLRAKNIRLIQLWVIIDLVLSSLLIIPYTGAGKNSVAHLQSVFNTSPKGIPKPDLHPVIDNDTISKANNNLLGSWSMYNKQPGTTTEMPYPIQLKNMRAFFDKTTLQERFGYFQKPFLFIKEGNDSLNILKFSPNKIIISVNTDRASKLIIQQNRYPHWYYKTSEHTEKAMEEGFNFMAVPVIKGENRITLFFEPTKVKWALFISALVLLLYVLLILFHKTKRY